MGLGLMEGLWHLRTDSKLGWFALGCNELPVTGGNQGKLRTTPRRPWRGSEWGESTTSFLLILRFGDDFKILCPGCSSLPPGLRSGQPILESCDSLIARAFIHQEGREGDTHTDMEDQTDGETKTDRHTEKSTERDRHRESERRIFQGWVLWAGLRVPPGSYVEFLTPKTLECDLPWNSAVAEVILGEDGPSSHVPVAV